jgi:hypothetical protein
MVRVVDQEREFVEEYCLRFLERDAVLPLILSILPFVPLEPEAGHVRFIVNTV